MEKITKLTPEQEATLPAFRERYLQAGLSTEPASLERIRHLINQCYSEIGKESVPVILVASPLSAQVLIHALKMHGRASLADSLRDSLGTSLADSLRDSLRASLGASLRASLGASLRASLGASLGDSLGASLRASLADSLRASLGASLRASLRASRIPYEFTYFWGQMDLYWVAYYKFCQEIGVDYERDDQEKLQLMDDIGHACGFIYFFEGLCIVSDRPESVHMEDGVLHHPQRPAVRFRDGWEIYAWRGTVVPGEWIADPDSVTADIALHHDNIEQRRAACEIVGWAKILEKLNARSIDKNASAQIGELLEADIPEIGRERFLKVECGTGRTFALPVPPEMQTAAQANAWTYGLDTNDYQPEIRT